MLIQHIFLGMRQLIWSFALALLLPAAASAQPYSFSEPTPLATTHYASDATTGFRIVSNGTMPYLLWQSQDTVRITPVTDVRRVGRPVLTGFSADAVWTGSFFLVAAIQQNAIVGRRVGADGEAIGDPFTIRADGATNDVHLAFDGTRVLLLYAGSGQPGGNGQPLQWMLLSREGAPSTDPQPVPVSVDTRMATDVTARAGEFVVAIAGKTNVAIGTLQNTLWNLGLHPAADANARTIAVAANATETLAIWTTPFAPLEAKTFSTNAPGQVMSYVLSDTSGASVIAATWDGKDFIYSYDRDARIHSRYFNAPFPFASATAARSVDLVSVNGRTYGAWHTASEGPVIVRDVATGAGDAGAFSAEDQIVYASASSATSALFTWIEGGRTYAGIRTADGNWYERRIISDDPAPVLAASDGRNFVVIHASWNDMAHERWSSTLLDPEGRILATGPRVQFLVSDVAWTGTAYVVVGMNDQNQVVASLLSPAGTVTPPGVVAVPRSSWFPEGVTVAVREGELLIAWKENFACAFPCLTPPSDFLGARFTPLLQRTDAQSLLLVEGEAWLGGDVIWDGTRYVIAWGTGPALRYRTLRTNSAISGPITVPGAQWQLPGLIVAPDGTVALRVSSGIAFFREGAETVVPIEPTAWGSRLARLGNRLALVESRRRDEAPYHGAIRLTLRIGDIIPPAQKPSAPLVTRATLSSKDNVMIVDWTKPAEPVNGYRVEYRVDDGVWNELDLWFDSRATQLVIRPWRSDPVRYQFRVRAVNDAGFGPYSATALVRSHKIRAVR